MLFEPANAFFSLYFFASLWDMCLCLRDKSSRIILVRHLSARYENAPSLLVKCILRVSRLLWRFSCCINHIIPVLYYLGCNIYACRVGLVVLMFQARARVRIASNVLGGQSAWNQAGIFFLQYCRVKVAFSFLFFSFMPRFSVLSVVEDGC